MILLLFLLQPVHLHLCQVAFLLFFHLLCEVAFLRLNVKRLCFGRMSRQVAVDLNTEPSQSEQIVWDDPTAREERAKLADNLQWPGSPSQHSEPLALVPLPLSDHTTNGRDSMTDSELVEMGMPGFALKKKKVLSLGSVGFFLCF